MRSHIRSPLTILALICGPLWGSASATPQNPGEEANTPLSPPLRMALIGPHVPVPSMCTHLYEGGFTIKTLIFNTLVKRDATGRIVPNLVSAWEFLDGGKSLLLTVRDDAVFHSDRPVDAATIRWNLLCWAGNPEHLWLPAARRIRAVSVVDIDKVRIDMDRPYALLGDLCATNPCGILAPDSIDPEGFYEKPIGSGAYAFRGTRESGRVLQYRRFDPTAAPDAPARELEVVLFPEKNPGAAVDALLRGEVDLVADSWLTRIPRTRIDELRDDPRVAVSETAGSPLFLLQFNLRSGPASELAFREHVRARIDRGELIRKIEHGHADPCRSWAAPAVSIWPRSRLVDGPPKGAAPELKAPLRLLVEESKAWARELAPAIVAQLESAGWPTKLVVLARQEHDRTMSAGEYDLRLTRTWGLPYDPYLTLVDRFMPLYWEEEEVLRTATGTHAAMLALVREAMACPDLDSRLEVYHRIQDFMDREAITVPLYAAHRFAVVRAGLQPPRMGADLYRIDLDPVFASR